MNRLRMFCLFAAACGVLGATAELFAQTTDQTIAIVPNSLDYGFVVPGTAVVMPIAVNNVGTSGSLAITGASIIGGAGWFEFTNSPAGAPSCLGLLSCTYNAPLSIAPGAFQRIQVHCLPPLGAAGTQAATLIVSSNSVVLSGNTATLTCAANVVPIVTLPTSPASCVEGQICQFTVGFTDPDSDTVTLHLESLEISGGGVAPPSNPVLSSIFPDLVGTISGTQRFRWTPGFSDGTQTYIAVFTATDTIGGTSGDVAYTITVHDSNVSPIVTMPGSPASCKEGLPCLFTVGFTDPDGDTVTLHLKSLKTSGGASPPSNPTLSAIFPDLVGTISGTQQFTWTPGFSDGTQTFLAIFTATDMFGGTSGDVGYAVTVHDTCQTISVSPSDLPGAVIGVAYSQILTPSGGTPPYGFALTGTLPSGLSLNSATGVISGVSTAATSATFTITATDASGCTGQKGYTITTVCPTISVTPSVLAGGSTGVSYMQTLSASGGTGPYTLGVTSGALPTGLALDPSSGVLSGTPTSTGPFTFTLTATDAKGCSASQSYTLIVIAETPVQQIDALITMVGRSGPGSSLVAKLDAAKADLISGDARAACSVLDAFIHAVKAQSGKSLTAAQASAFIDAARRIEVAARCS